MKRPYERGWGNAMKTTTRTTLPDNTHEQPVYELKYEKTVDELFRPIFYLLAAIFLLISPFAWRVDPIPRLIKEGGPGMVIGLVIPMIVPLCNILFLAIASTAGNVYIYER